MNLVATGLALLYESGVAAVPGAVGSFVVLLFLADKLQNPRALLACLLELDPGVLASCRFTLLQTLACGPTPGAKFSQRQIPSNVVEKENLLELVE